MDKFILFISDQKKLLVLRELILAESEVMVLVRKIKTISQPGMSIILKEMRDLGLVKVKIDGKKRIYKIEREMLNKKICEMKNFLSEFEEKIVDEIIIRR